MAKPAQKPLFLESYKGLRPSKPALAHFCPCKHGHNLAPFSYNHLTLYTPPRPKLTKKDQKTRKSLKNKQYKEKIA